MAALDAVIHAKAAKASAACTALMLFHGDRRHCGDEALS